MTIAPETVIRPFTDENVFPTPFIKPGTRSQEPVFIRIGYRGGTKMFHTTSNASFQLYMSRKSMESPGRNKSMQDEIGNSGEASSYNGRLSAFKNAMAEDAGQPGAN